MTRTSTKYVLEMSASFAAYAVILVAVNLFYDRWEGGSQSGWRFALAVLPMIPAVFTIRAIVRHLHRVDELEQLIQFKCLAIAFASTAFLTFTYGFLEGVGLPKLSMFWVWPLMGTCWFIARFAVGRTYS